ncbi:3-keto-disaccharide hydrolase [Verrucomicrobiota bacterium sgz303538]
MIRTPQLLFVLATMLSAGVASAAEGKSLGYQDTPIIPGTKWHVHDGERPQPKVVTPGEFPTQEKAGTAPSDAVVLFDGKDLSQWKSGKGGGEAGWKVENGYFEVVKGAGDIFTKGEFGPDVQLHVEWTAPNPPHGSGQGRGNSGIFLFGRYEFQVLDSYDNPTYPDGQATAVYGFMPPLVNASRPPGQWQAYDIIFNGPRFENNQLKTPAYVTILHNGVLTQNHTQLIGDTPHRQVGTYKPHGEKGPIKLQDHGDPVRYRNIWIRELKPVDTQ